MRSYYLYLLAILSLLGVLSCSKDDASEKNVRKEVKVTATFNGLSVSGGVTTRAVDNSWVEGDAIGLFMKKAGSTLTQDALANNVKYTTDGGVAFTNSLGNKVYFPYKKEDVDFISYYPYTDKLNGFTYEIDVSNQTDLPAIDLMYANNVKTVNSSAESINLYFKHQLTKVVLNLVGDFTEGDPVKFEAKITNVNTQASFSLSDGLLTDKKEPVDVHFFIDKDKKKAEAILLPEDDISNCIFIITVGNITYSYPLKDSETIESFAPATKCVYNISLESNEDRVLQNVTAVIEKWTTVSDDVTATETEPDEGDAPVPPVEGDGTKQNPYTIAQAIGLEKGTRKWVKGYIVGSYPSSFDSFTADTGGSAATMNLALADSPDDKSTEKYLPVVDLLEGSEGSAFQKKLNLNNNPINLGKAVLIQGKIEKMAKNSITKNSIAFLDSVYLEGVVIKF